MDWSSRGTPHFINLSSYGTPHLMGLSTRDTALHGFIKWHQVAVTSYFMGLSRLDALLLSWFNKFVKSLHRGSYMSARVLLNLLNELGKRNKMWGLSSILPLFCSEFNKFNNTRAPMLDSIYHMTLSLLWNLISAVKNVIISSLCMQRCYGRHNGSWKYINH